MKLEHYLYCWCLKWKKGEYGGDYCINVMVKERYVSYSETVC